MKDVVAAVERVTDQSVPCRMAARRAGDPAVLLASSERARVELGWTPRFEEIDVIVRTAWEWHRSHPDGYRSHV